jgi:hypothetical protein
LTRTVPTPGTLFALIVTAAGDDVPAGALLDEFAGVPLDEPAPVPVEDVPQAAAVATAPRARLPNSSRRPGERWGRWAVMLKGKSPSLCSTRLGCFPLTTKTRANGIG